MKKILEMIKVKMGLLMSLLMLTSVSLANTIQIAGRNFGGTEGNQLIQTFNPIYSIMGGFMFTIQVVVTGGVVIAILWQLIGFVSGQQVDLGKMIIYIVGGIMVIALLWFAPYLMNLVIGDKNNGALIVNYSELLR